MKRLNGENEYEFGIYEVYYDDKGNVKGWTENSLTPTCSSEDKLFEELDLMKRAFAEETLVYKKD